MRLTTGCLYVCALGAISITASARGDVSATLQTLIAGSPVTVGNATFSNFTLSGGNVAASAIQVAITSPTAGATNINFSVPPSGWLSAANATSSGNSQIEFDVSFTTPIKAIGLDFTATGSQGVAAIVGETVTDKTTLGTYSLQVITDGTGPLADSFSQSKAVSPAATSLHVQKSIDISGGGVGLASITSVDNTFTVPEPGCLLIFSGAMVGLVMRRRRNVFRG